MWFCNRCCVVLKVKKFQFMKIRAYFGSYWRKSWCIFVNGWIWKRHYCPQFTNETFFSQSAHIRKVFFTSLESGHIVKNRQTYFFFLCLASPLFKVKRLTKMRRSRKGKKNEGREEKKPRVYAHCRKHLYNHGRINSGRRGCRHNVSGVRSCRCHTAYTKKSSRDRMKCGLHECHRGGLAGSSWGSSSFFS